MDPTPQWAPPSRFLVPSIGTAFSVSSSVRGGALLGCVRPDLRGVIRTATGKEEKTAGPGVPNRPCAYIIAWYTTGSCPASVLLTLYLFHGA